MDVVKTNRNTSGRYSNDMIEGQDKPAERHHVVAHTEYRGIKNLSANTQQIPHSHKPQTTISILSRPHTPRN